MRAYRLLQGVIALTRSHPRERVDWVCGTALERRCFRYQVLKRLADAASPLWQSFDDGQKRRAPFARDHMRPASHQQRIAKNISQPPEAGADGRLALRKQVCGARDAPGTARPG